MTRRRRTLPPVSPKLPVELRPLISAMTEILETGEGVRGDPLDRKATLRDLLDSGIARARPGVRPGYPGSLIPGENAPPPDMTTPPPAQGFAAHGSFYGMINLSWQDPAQLYSNHAYANIYRSEEDNFANAEVVGRALGIFYSDYVRSDAIDPNNPEQLKGYYYWIAFVSTSDVEGPPNAGSGTYARPIADVDYVLDLISERINETHLAESLREPIGRIGLIDGPEEMEGSVAHRISLERAERIAALQGERDQTAAQIAQEASARSDQFGQIVTMIDDLEAGLDGDYSAGLTLERQARIAGDEALASDITSLTAAADQNAADIINESQARATAVEAVASDVAAVYAATEALEGEILDESQVRATEDDLLAGVQRVISAAGETQAASIYSLSQIRITEHELVIQQIDQMSGELDDAHGLIHEESQIRLQQDQALVGQMNTMQASLEGLLNDETDNREAAISAIQSELETQVTRIDGRVDIVAQQVNTVQTALVDEVSDLESAISSVQQAFGSEINRVDGAISANAQAVSDIQSSVGDDFAAVRQEMETNISEVDGTISALWTARVQANGLIGGFGLGTDGDTVVAGFDVDQFYIGREDSEKRRPFMMGEDGVAYFNEVMIREGSIQEGQLGPITVGKLFSPEGEPITTAGGLIRADAIDVDSLHVASAATFSDDVYSSNYVAGQSGWMIRQNGFVEFNEATIRGNLEVRTLTVNGHPATGGALVQTTRLNRRSRGSRNSIDAHDRTVDVTRTATTNIPGMAQGSRIELSVPWHNIRASANVSGRRRYFYSYNEGDGGGNQSGNAWGSLRDLRVAVYLSVVVKVDGVTVISESIGTTSLSNGSSLSRRGDGPLHANYTYPAYRASSTVSVTVRVYARSYRGPQLSNTNIVEDDLDSYGDFPAGLVTGNIYRLG